MTRLPAAQRREQELQALELSTAGHSVSTIADRLGVSSRTAERRLQSALRRIPAWIADDLRRQEEERLNAGIRRCHALLESDHEVETEMKIRNHMLALQREKITLFGLRLPAAYVVSLETGGQE